jgi:hypothetical protein
MPVRLEPGKLYDITATVLDSLGNPSMLDDPTFTQTGTPDEVVTLTQTGDSTATVLAVAPGSDTVTFAGSDAFSNAVEAEVELEVGDATALRLVARDSENCTLTWVSQGTVHVTVPAEPAGDPSFTLQIVPVNEQGQSNGLYAFADGPNTVSTHGRVLLNGNGAGVPVEDDAEVACLVTARGAETFTASAITAGSGAVIGGVLQILVITASTASLAVTRQPTP